MKRLFIPLIKLLGRRIEKKKFTSTPIYIGGCGRSGTTLLLSILSAHDDIFACPKELNLFENAKQKNNQLSLPKLYRLYRTFITHNIKSTANRYCEKSPVNIHKIDLIDQHHSGNFKFIHIVRDGRDVILSKHPKRKNEYWVSPERWIEDVGAGLKYKSNSKVLLIRYEDLIGKYEESAKAISLFLEIDYSDEIKNWHQYATVRKNNALFSSISTLHDASIGKWKLDENILRAKDLISIEEGSRLLNELNYQ